MKRHSTRREKAAVPLVGIVDVASVVLAGSASAAIGGPTTDKPLQATASSQASY
jgi:hypothetical protein